MEWYRLASFTCFISLTMNPMGYKWCRNFIKKIYAETRPLKQNGKSKFIQSANTSFTIRRVKVKESRNRPGVTQRVSGGLGFQISRHSAHEGVEVSLTYRPLYFQEMFLVLVFTRGWVDPRAMVRSEGIYHWKIQWHHRESIPGPSD